MKLMMVDGTLDANAVVAWDAFTRCMALCGLMGMQEIVHHDGDLMVAMEVRSMAKNLYRVWCTTFGADEVSDEVSGDYVRADDPEEAACLWGENYYNNGNDPFGLGGVDVMVRDTATGMTMELELGVDYEPVFHAHEKRES